MPVFTLVSDMEALNESINLRREKKKSPKTPKASMIYCLLGGNEHACCLT